ncbi:MAG: hypothetical protein Q9226_008324, partial [Calogaya cf. arnoldii]
MSRRPQYIQNTLSVLPLCPGGYIGSADGNALQDETLEDIATAFLGIDAEFVGVLEIVLNNAASGKITVDPVSLRTLPQDQAMVSDIKTQIKDIKEGKYRFHEHYQRGRLMLSIWHRSSGALAQMLDLDRTDPANHNLLNWIDSLFHRVERFATPLIHLLSTAAVKGVLDSEDRAVIRLRMLRLDEAFDMYHRRTASTRTLKT